MYTTLHAHNVWHKLYLILDIAILYSNYSECTLLEKIHEPGINVFLKPCTTQGGVNWDFTICQKFLLSNKWHFYLILLILFSEIGPTWLDKLELVLPPSKLLYFHFYFRQSLTHLYTLPYLYKLFYPNSIDAHYSKCRSIWFQYDDICIGDHHFQ